MTVSRAKTISLTDEEVIVLARLWNEPQRSIGPIAESLLAKKLIKHDKGWTSLTPAGRKARDAEFKQRGGFGDLVTKFWGRELA